MVLAVCKQEGAAESEAGVEGRRRAVVGVGCAKGVRSAPGGVTSTVAIHTGTA